MIMIIPDLLFPSGRELAAWKSDATGASAWVLLLPSCQNYIINNTCIIIIMIMNLDHQV